MPFDPDAYIAKKSSFDPDAYLERKGVKKESWLDTEIPLVGGKVGENIVRPLLQGAGLVGGGIAGAPLGPVGAVAGGGLGYAGAEEVYKMMGGRPSGTLGEELVKAGENVATGAAMEAGGQALPVALSGAAKIPGMVKSGVQKVLPKPRVGQVKTGGDIINVLKSEKEAFTPSLGTEIENLKYIDEGLEPLTPVQMQPRAGAEPTPAQYTETLLKARDEGLYNQQAKQLQKYRDVLEQYQTKGSATPEIAGQKVKEGISKAKEPFGEEIGKFKQAGKDIKLGEDIEIPDPRIHRTPSGTSAYYDVSYKKPINEAQKKQYIDKITDEYNLGKELIGKPKPSYMSADVKKSKVAFYKQIEAEGGLEKYIGKRLPKDVNYKKTYRFSDHPVGLKRATENNEIYKNIKDLPRAKEIIKEELQGDFPVSRLDEFSLVEDFSKLKSIEKMYNKAQTIQELDTLSSNVGSQLKDASGNYGKKLREVKSFLEDKIAKTIEGTGISKPEEAYDVYTQYAKLQSDTLKGTLKTGQSKNVIKKITASGENIKQFKDTANVLKAPELITSVKENWLNELFNEATERNPGKWITKWIKFKKEGIPQNLLNKEDIKKIDILADYYGKYTSTTTGAVNPSRSGVIAIDDLLHPIRSTAKILKYILGDELKYAKALRQYKSIYKNTPEITSNRRMEEIPYIIGRDKE